MVPCLGRAALDHHPRLLDSRLREEEDALLRHLGRCANPRQLKQAHARILRRGLSRSPVLLTSLLRHYASHRLPRLASHVLSLFPTAPPAFAWNLVIRAHTLSGSPVDALVLAYNRMIVLGVPPDKFTFPFAVKACSGCRRVDKGKEIYAFAIKTGFYKDVFLQNALMHLYLHCGDEAYGRLMFDTMRVRTVVSWTTLMSGLVSHGEMVEAQKVFDAMPVRNVVSWTAMIDGYARNGQPEEAFELFRRMQTDNVTPNAFTLVGLLVACTELSSLALGRWVHDFARETCGLERDVFVGTALIDMYSKCGSLEDAVGVFEQMPVKNLATWNSMITSLGVHGHGMKAVRLFQEMEKDASVVPDEITFVGVLCACVRDGMVNEGSSYFRHMIEYYGIKPNKEHWNCLLELLEHASPVDDTPKVAALGIEQDMNGWPLKLIGHDRVHADNELEKQICQLIDGLKPGGINDNLDFHEHKQCKWEVG